MGPLYRLLHQNIVDFENKDWTLGLVIPEDEMIGAINKTNRMLLIIAFAILVAALVFTIILQQLEKSA